MQQAPKQVLLNVLGSTSYVFEVTSFTIRHQSHTLSLLVTEKLVKNLVVRARIPKHLVMITIVNKSSLELSQSAK